MQTWGYTRSKFPSKVFPWNILVISFTCSLKAPLKGSLLLKNVKHSFTILILEIALTKTWWLQFTASCMYFFYLDEENVLDIWFVHPKIAKNRKSKALSLRRGFLYLYLCFTFVMNITFVNFRGGWDVAIAVKQFIWDRGFRDGFASFYYIYFFGTENGK